MKQLDATGPQALSIRGLAATLGVAPMTLYGYFTDKEALLDAVVDAIADAAELPVEEGDWDERLRALLGMVHRSLLEHPGLVALRFARPIATPSAFRVTEACMVALRDAGLDRHAAAAAFRALFVFTFGAAAFAARAGSADRAAVGDVLSALPADEFPELRAIIPDALELLDPSRAFDAGLDLLLTGIRATAAGGA
jgi:AcrR family transcriptional regulator